MLSPPPHSHPPKNNKKHPTNLPREVSIFVVHKLGQIFQNGLTVKSHELFSADLKTKLLCVGRNYIHEPSRVQQVSCPYFFIQKTSTNIKVTMCIHALHNFMIGKHSWCYVHRHRDVSQVQWKSLKQYTIHNMTFSDNLDLSSYEVKLSPKMKFQK